MFTLSLISIRYLTPTSIWSRPVASCRPKENGGQPCTMWNITSRSTAVGWHPTIKWLGPHHGYPHHGYPHSSISPHTPPGSSKHRSTLAVPGLGVGGRKRKPLLLNSRTGKGGASCTNVLNKAAFMCLAVWTPDVGGLSHCVLWVHTTHPRNGMGSGFLEEEDSCSGWHHYVTLPHCWKVFREEFYQ